MKAAVVKDKQVSFVEFAMPEAGEGGTVVQMCAAALTNLDIITAEGRHFFSPGFPAAVVGNEGVAKLPSGERRYFPVTSMIAPFGSMAEYALAQPHKSLPIIDEIPDALAAALGNAGLAGWLPFSWRAAMKPGENVLVLGATGAAGLIAVAAARLLGAGRIIAAGRSERSLEKAKTLGADVVVRLDQMENVQAALLDAVGDKGIDVAVDYINAPATQYAMEVMAVGGRFVQVGALANPTVSVTAQLLRKQSLSLMGFAYFHAPHDEQTSAYLALSRAALKGDVFIDHEKVSLSMISDAWARQKVGSAPRFVLMPG